MDLIRSLFKKKHSNILSPIVVAVFEKSGTWYHFCDFEGDKGWIHKSMVDKISSIITNNIKCNIRSGPGTT